MSTMIPVCGNTYPVKDQLKSLGGRWNPDRKCWMIPEENADKAYAIVQSAPSKSASSNGSYRTIGQRMQQRQRATGWTGCACGSIEGRPRASDCWTCRHDAE